MIPFYTCARCLCRTDTGCDDKSCPVKAILREKIAREKETPR